MKLNGAGKRPARRDRLIRERNHDTYMARSKYREPTVCPDCGVVYHKGRWQWIARPEGAHATLCPACQRMHDRYPGGFLTLSGEFLAKHRDEIVHLARNVEEREKSQHPLQRIMALEPHNDGILITTTQMEMARAIGDAVHHAYQGELDYRYTDEANILRVSWKR